MMRRTIHIVLVSLLISFSLLAALNISSTTYANTPSIDCNCKGVVQKKPGEAFTVKITFKNTGSTKGTWSINVSFEDGWTWKGNAQTLVLNPNEKETLTWNGNVPLDAPVGSTARLIVYFNNDFKALDWWILVVSDAQLSVVQSEVK